MLVSFVKEVNPHSFPKEQQLLKKIHLAALGFTLLMQKMAGHFVGCTKAIANLLVWDFELKQNIINVPNWLIFLYSSAIPTLGKKKEVGLFTKSLSHLTTTHI